MSIKVVTDSTAYIPEEMLKKYDISVVSLNVSFENESFRELDIDKLTFYDKMAQSKRIPTSSQPSVSEVYKVFEKWVKQGDSVVGIFLSSDMSGTYSSAHLVKQMILDKYPDAVIELIDSRSNCMQAGFVVLEAARAACENKEMSEVLETAGKVIHNSRFLFVPDTLEYLKKGGRIGGAAALLGAILQIRPILTVVDGKTAIFDKVRTKKKALERIINTFIEDMKGQELGEVVVHHINCEEEGKDMASRIEDIIGKAVKVCSIGPVIGLHVGPGTLGLAYYKK